MENMCTYIYIGGVTVQWRTEYTVARRTAKDEYTAMKTHPSMRDNERLLLQLKEGHDW
jgi:hypothetical protein